MELTEGNRTTAENIFVAGDFNTGPLDVIHAVADAKDAAAAIDESLMDRYGFTWDNHEMLYSGTREKPENLQINSVENYVRYHAVSLLETVRNTEGAPKLKAISKGNVEADYRIIFPKK